MALVPSPRVCGLPEQFESWRDTQAEAFDFMQRSTKRVKAVCVPTGGGKSPLVVGMGLHSKKPTAIVTDSRALQDQYGKLYGACGMVDLRGRSNYPCSLRPDVEDYTCDLGYAAQCPLKGTPKCPSSLAEMRAGSSWLVCTNYEKWIHSRRYGMGLSHIERVVFDEGHRSYSALAKAMQITLQTHEVEDVLGLDFPDRHEAEFFGTWRTWAGRAREIGQQKMKVAEKKLTERDPKASWVKRYLHLRTLVRRLSILATANPTNWVVDEVQKGYVFDPIQPGRYAESALLLQVPDITIISATLIPKTLYMIGIGKDDFEMQDYPSEFDAARCPIYYVPTMKVDSKAGDLGMLWARLDQIGAQRRDRNGLVHTISYTRRDEIISRSRILREANAGGKLFYNERGEPATAAIGEFTGAYPGAVLVSPSIGQGFDFYGCMAPDTPVLKSDLTYVEVASLRVGDELLAFTESPPKGQRARAWSPSTVLANRPIKKQCRRLILIDGTEFICSDDHPWLTTTSHRSCFWYEARKLKTHHHHLMQICDYWETDASWEAGYLAGIWDGEGHLTQGVNRWRKNTPSLMPHTICGMSQTTGRNSPVLDETRRALDKLGFRYREHHSRSEHLNRQPLRQIHLSGMRDLLRFLGSVRPSRMLAQFSIPLLGSIRPARFVPIICNESAGVREVSSLSTSSKTFVARGFASHNTAAEWQFIAKIPFPPPSKVMKARCDPQMGGSKDHAYYLAWQAFVQIAGRVMRDHGDQGETFIGDDHLQWFLNYRYLAPRSFHQFFKQVSVLPPPPARLPASYSRRG